MPALPLPLLPSPPKLYTLGCFLDFTTPSAHCSHEFFIPLAFPSHLMISTTAHPYMCSYISQEPILTSEKSPPKLCRQGSNQSCTAPWGLVTGDGRKEGEETQLHRRPEWAKAIKEGQSSRSFYNKSQPQSTTVRKSERKRWPWPLSVWPTTDQIQTQARGQGSSGEISPQRAAQVHAGCIWTSAPRILVQGKFLEASFFMSTPDPHTENSHKTLRDLAQESYLLSDLIWPSATCQYLSLISTTTAIEILFSSSKLLSIESSLPARRGGSCL